MNSVKEMEQQKKFYDERWGGIKFAGHLNLLRCIAILNAIATTKLRAPRIIDLGCGTGWLSSIVGAFGPTVAVDLSDNAIAEASKKYRHVQFIAANIFDWDYPRRMFDIVISQEVIEHVEDQEHYLEIAHGVLKDGGYLILTTPNPATMNAMPDEQRLAWSNQPLENYITINQLKSMINSKFNIIYSSTIILGYGNKGLLRIINSTFVNSMLKKLKIYDLFRDIMMKCGYGLHTIVLAKKI